MNEFTDFKTYKMKNKKIYQYVFDYFSEQILSGELKINDNILPEREIAEKLDVSRNSIREVMHMLEINGLLDCRQGSGNYINAMFISGYQEAHPGKTKVAAGLASMP